MIRECRFDEPSHRACPGRIEDLVRRLGGSDRVMIAREDKQRNRADRGDGLLTNCTLAYSGGSIVKHAEDHHKSLSSHDREMIV
jgi:hypothetical protein